MPFTNSSAAATGLLVMHAMDMYRAQPGRLMPKAATALTDAGWTIVAYITGQDSLLLTRQFQLADKTVCYGYLARRASGEFVAAVRGTDGFVEWVEDGQFVPIPYAPRGGLPDGAPLMLVEQGFWRLYDTMQLIDLDGRPLGPLAPAITAAAGGSGPVIVVGHSLGSALATYLTLDLARGSLGERVWGCLFASPHTGNKTFVDLFDQTVQDYRLFNYILDIVPRVPLGPTYSPLPRRTVLQPANAEAQIRVGIQCAHHVICYCAMLDYEGTTRTAIPADERASAACILGPETGHPSLAKRLVADLAGIVPV